MNSIRVLAADLVPIQFFALKSDGGSPAKLDPVTGKATLQIQSIQRNSDGQFFDFTDDTFRAVAVLKTALLTEIDATDRPGWYHYIPSGVRGWDLSGITNAVAAGDTYTVTFGPESDADVALFGAFEIIAGGWVKDVLDDTSAMDARLPTDPADQSLLVAEHDATQASLVTIQADTDNIQARLPAALVTGRMDASVGAMAADTLTASALAADAVTEIQVGLATAAELTTLQASVLRVLGLTGHNQVIAVLTKNANGDALTQRIRHYDTLANAQLDDGATGLLDTYNIVATYDVANSLDTFEMVREGS